MQESQKYLESISRNRAISLFESITSYVPRLQPSRPEKLVAYDKASRSEQEKIKEYLFKDEDIKDYLDLKWSVELENKIALEYLYEYWNSCEKKEENVVVESRIRSIYNVIKGYKDKPYPALSLNIEQIRNSIVKSNKSAKKDIKDFSEPVQKAVELFKGTVVNWEE